MKNHRVKWSMKEKALQNFNFSRLGFSSTASKIGGSGVAVGLYKSWNHHFSFFIEIVIEEVFNFLKVANYCHICIFLVELVGFLKNNELSVECFGVIIVSANFRNVIYFSNVFVMRPIKDVWNLNLLIVPARIPYMYVVIYDNLVFY